MSETTTLRKTIHSFAHPSGFSGHYVATDGFNTPSEADRILIKDRLVQDAEADPARVERFLSIMEQNRVRLVTTGISPQSIGMTVNDGTDAANRSFVYIDPRMVGQDSYDLIGTVMERLAVALRSHLVEAKAQSSGGFAGLDSYTAFVEQKETRIRDLEARLGSIESLFPETAQTRPTFAPSTRSPVGLVPGAQ